jgi:hypothetical protein
MPLAFNIAVRLAHACLFLVATSATGSAATPQSAANTNVGTDGCLIVRFDRTPSSLPARFCGHSWASVVTSLGKLGLEKDRYETSAQHSIRVMKLLQRPLYGAVAGTGMLAFSTPVKTEYDADKASYTVWAPMELLSNYQWSLQVGKNSASGQAYSAENAFGVKKAVSTEMVRSVVLQSKATPVGSKSLFAYIKYPPAKARDLDGHQLAFLFIGRLSAPFLTTDRTYDRPTISSPVERITTHTVIGFALSETWLYDYSTGIVLSKSVRLH